MNNHNGNNFSNELRDFKAVHNRSTIVAITDTDGTILDVNDKFCEISKYSRAELLGQNQSLLKSGFHPPEFMSNLWSTIQSGEVWHDLIKNRAQDGSHYWVDTTILPLLDDDGKPVRYISIQHDVTRQKLSEEELDHRLEELRVIEEELRAHNEELLSARELLTTAFILSPNALLISNVQDGKIIEINENGAELLGYPRSYLIGRTSTELKLFFNPTDRFRALEILKKENRLHNFAASIRTSTGEIKDVVFSTEKLKIGGKERLLTVIRDDTARKQAETKLRESEQQMRLVLNAAQIGIWVYDIVADRTFWSVEQCQIFGIESFDGQSETFWKMIDERDRARVYEKFHEAIENKCFYDVEYRITRDDGENRWIKGLGQCDYDAAGKPVRFLGATLDITARKLSAEKLRESEEQLQIAVEVADFAVCEIDYRNDTAHLTKEAAALFDLGDAPVTVQRCELHSKFHPADAADVFNLIGSALDPNGDGWFACEHRIVRKNGETRWLNVRKKVFFDQTAAPLLPQKAILVAQDITERKRAEANLAFLAEISQDLVHFTNIDETIERVGEKIGRFFGVKHCMFAEHVDEFETSVVAYGWHAPDAPDLKGTYRMRDFLSDKMMSAVMTGAPLVVTETQGDARVSAERYGALGIRSFIIVPLIREEAWRFQIAIIDDKPRVWSDDEIKLMRELTDRIWTRLERARAEKALRESEEKLRLFIEYAPASVAMFDRQMRYLAVSRRWMRDYDLKGDVIGRSHYEVFPDLPERFKRIHRKCLAGATEKSDEDSFQLADGSLQWQKWEIRPWFDTTGAIGGIVIFTEDITRIKEATEVVRESQKRFEQIANSLPQLVWTCLPDGQCDFLSRQWVEYTGISEAEQLGYDWLEQLHPEDRKPTVQAWKKAVAEDSLFNIEYRLRRYDGIYRVFDTRAVPLYDTGGKIVKWFGSNTDITEQKQAIALLAESEERYRSLFETSRDGIVTVDLNGYILEANPAYQAMLGYTWEELRTIRYQELTPPRWHDTEADIVRRLILPPGDSGEYEKEYIRKDGSVFPINIRTWAVTDAKGKTIGLRAHVRDITERKKAEQLIEEKNQLLEQSYDAIFIWNIDDGIIYWHPNAEQLYGYSEQEAVGREAHELLKTVFPKPLPEFIDELKEKGYWEGEIIDTTKTGAEVIAEARLHVIRRDERNLIVLETLRDVTERRQTEAKLARAAQLALVGEFAAGLAHEIKNPLAGIKGVIDILLQQSEWQQSEDHEILESVRHEIERIDKTVRALLQHSRPKPLEIKTAPLNETVRRAAQFAGLQKKVGQLRREKIPIQLVMPEEPIVVAHDSAGLEGAVLNLILNACDAVDEKTDGIIFVRLKKSVNGKGRREALIEVEDNGVGIAPERLDKIFTPFQTSKHDGTGLGLTSVKRIVRAHSGECEVRSIIGEGTMFTIRLPLGLSEDK